MVSYMQIAYLALAAIASAAPTGTAGSVSNCYQSTYDTVQNGDFEQDAVVWQTTGRGMVDDSRHWSPYYAFNGSRLAWMTTAKADPTPTLSQTLQGLNGTNSYTLNYAYQLGINRALNAGEQCQLIVAVGAETIDTVTVAGNWAGWPNNDGWIKRSASFTGTTFNKTLKFSWNCSPLVASDDHADVALDSISLTTALPNLITNGNFEDQSLRGWQLDNNFWPSFRFQYPPAYNGNAYAGWILNQDKNVGMTSQRFSTIPGTPYKLSFAYRQSYLNASDAPTARPLVATQCYLYSTTDMQILGGFWVDPTGQKEWKYAQLSWVANNTATTLQISTRCGENVIKAVVGLDAVSVKQDVQTTDVVVPCQ